MTRLYRKVIRIRGQDSPNVKLGLTEQHAGKTPTGRMLLPGVLSFDEYCKRRATWDDIRQCIGLDAQFWEGAEFLLYPPDWLNRAEEIARRLVGEPRRALAIGIDPAEGGNKTAMAAVDEFGLLQLKSRATSNTAVITNEALAFMNYWNVLPERVIFDSGGGGKEHADRMREWGYPVQTVAFGESVTPQPKRGVIPLVQRSEQREERYVYKNRRAQMYGILANLLDPSCNERGFGIPVQYIELRRQLAPIPKLYDNEGRLYLPPKRQTKDNSTVKSLEQIIGCSPDEADAVVLAVYGMVREPVYVEVGAV